MKKFKKAVLIIHGFAGGVYDEEYLFERLQLQRNFDVFNFTLPGHDGDHSEKITRKDWIESAEKQVDFLIKHGYKSIYVIGHSMGGILATILASEYKEIKKLVLVAPAFRIFGFENCNIDVKDAIKKLPKIVDYYGVKTLASRMLRMSPNAFTEFLSLLNENQDTPSRVTIPTLIIRGFDDDVVPEVSVLHVFKLINCNQKKIIHYKETTHDVFQDSRRGIATKDICRFLKDKNSLLFINEEK